MTKVISLPRYELKWAKSKKLLAAHIEAYNQDKELKDQLRSAHRKLLEYMLYLYSLTLKKAQAYGSGIEPGRRLPSLRTNNEQLAGEMGCSIRTIQNLRRRLTAAGLITAERWHGTNSSYEVEICFDVIQLELRGDPANQIGLFAAPLSVNRKPQTADRSPKTLRHTVSRKQIQDTNELIKLSGVDFQKTPGFQEDTTVFNVKSRGKAQKSVEKPSENPQLVDDPVTRDTSTGYKTGRTHLEVGNRKSEVGKVKESAEEHGHKPEDVKPETLVEVVAGLPDQQIRTIGRHVDAIWNCAQAELYADKWICDQERARARARIAEYFIYARPDRYGAGAAEIIERILLVSKWIKRGQAGGEKRWVPLPSVYFDYRNERNGFTRTKAWYKQHLQAKREIKDNELLTKAIKEYLRSLEDGASVGPAETYRRIAQRLGKRSKALLDRFHQQINQAA